MELEAKYSYSAILALIPISLFVYMILRYRFSNLNRKTINNYFLIWICITIYSTWGFAEPDTYHYHQLYDEMVRYKQSLHVEPFYYWLVTILPNNFYLWRFVIWGTAAALIIYVAKRNYISSSALGLLIPVMFLHKFVVTRGALGLAFLMLVIYLYYSYRKKALAYSILFLGIFLSTYLHKSIPIFVLFALVALIIPFNKKLYWLSLIFFPIFYVLLFIISDYILGLNIFSEETVNFTTNYLEHESMTKNMLGYIMDMITYSPYIFVLFFVLPKFYFHNKLHDTPYGEFLFKYSYILFYVAFLFYNQPTSIWVFSRTIHAGMFALVFLFAMYYQRVHGKREKKLYYMFLLPTLLTYISLLMNWSKL